MSVPNESPVNSYTGNGATTKFPVTFQFETQNTLVLKVNGVVAPISDYYWTTDNSFNFYDAPASGAVIEIIRNTPKKRDNDYDDNYNTFRPKTLNKDFDRLWRVIQEYLIKIDRNSAGLAQETIDRIQADEDMLDYIMNQDNAIKQDYIQRDDVLKADYIERDETLKRYVDQLIALITDNPSFDGVDAEFVKDESGLSQQLLNDLNKPIEMFYAVGGALTPVSDLYTAGTVAFTPSKFKNFSDVQSYFPHVTAESDPLDWAAAQKSLNSEGYINFSSKQYFFGDKTLIIPTTGFRIEGKGYSTRINTSAEKAIKVADGTRLTNGFFGKFYLLGSNVVGSIGIDASAMAYCTFQNIFIRQFNDGWFADGSLNPVNKQYSNNTIINVRCNNNLRYGFYFDGDEYANSANTYTGCEAAGNGSIGFYENVGYSNQTVGCTFQGNPIDFLSNGTRNIHQFYTEINSKSVRFGSNSIGNELSIRSTFPLWNCVIDEGKQNKISNRGEESAIKYLFDNPNFTNWSAANPNNVAKNGSIVWSYFTDTTLRYGGGLQATINADYQGIIINGLGTASDLNHAWVTVQIDADTSGMTDINQFRIYCRDGSTNNSTNGEFFVGSWTKTNAGVYRSFTADIRFPVELVGTPSILIYPVHTGNTTSNVLKIKSIQVVSGQYFKLDPAPATEFVKSATSAILLDQTNGINIAFKFAGKVVHNSTVGVPMVARGSAASSVWEFMSDRYVTTTALSSATDAINTQFKTIGGQVYNTTDGKKYYATGTGATSNWKSTDGATTITPA